MDGFGFNRVATAVLLASFIILLVSNVVDMLYTPDMDQPRGYSVDTGASDVSGRGGAEKKVQQEVNIEVLLSAANASRGKDISKKCTACHTFNHGEANRVGPNLWGIIGAKQAHAPGFSYSKVLLSKGGTWNEKELFKFLTSPQSYARGTRMSFAGISKPQDIADLLAYIKSLEKAS